MVGLLALGLFAGVLSGMFGIGGGIIIGPALYQIWKLPVKTALGTSLGALLMPVGLLGAYELHRNGNLNVEYAAWIALGLFLGAYGGAKLAHLIEPQLMKRLFGGFLFLVACKMLIYP